MPPNAPDNSGAPQASVAAVRPSWAQVGPLGVEPALWGRSAPDQREMVAWGAGQCWFRNPAEKVRAIGRADDVLLSGDTKGWRLWEREPRLSREVLPSPQVTQKRLSFAQA